MKRYIKSNYEYKSSEQYLAELDSYEIQALEHIYNNISNKHCTYGEWVESEYGFNTSLYSSGGYIRWYYPLSYDSVGYVLKTRPNLAWVIGQIFNTTPSKFIEKYTCVGYDGKVVE